MYITLKSIKRNLGLFDLEIIDLVVGGVFLLIFIILFSLKLYTSSLVILSCVFLALVPIEFSKCNRIYKLFILFVSFLFKNKNYYFYKGGIQSRKH